MSDRDVLSLVNMRVFPLQGASGGNSYSNSSFNFLENTWMGIITLPRGGIFELKYPIDDIIGNAV